MHLLAGKCTMNELLEVMTTGKWNEKKEWFILLCVIGRNSDILKLVLILHCTATTLKCFVLVLLHYNDYYGL